MKLTIPHFTLVLALLAAQLPVQAALVDIPDANFRAKLKTLYPSCFVGDQMETTCSGITSATSLNVSNLSIADLAGIQYFTGLSTLNCSYNQLANLPALPSGLKTFICSSNQLTSLPALPSGLTSLTCNNNKLISLPPLPNGLTSLNCSSNKLISLPVLPSALTNLYCADNKLATLPTLLSGLTYLGCGTNQLTSLPPLPSGLFTLDCPANRLTSLPALLSVLTHLFCGNNQLISLPSLPSGLSVLYFDSNQLASLPSLPNGLDFLNGEYNLLDFADLEAISFKPTSYSASPQSYFIFPAAQAIMVGTNLVLDGTIGGSANQYKWYKNNVLISGANAATFTKAAVTSVDAGTYKCVVTSTASNSTVTGVTITSSDVVITITKANQTITFSPLPSKTLGDEPIALSATASSGLAVSYVSSNTAVATVSGNTVTVVGAGTTSITASQAGDATYNAAASVVQSLTITELVTGIEQTDEDVMVFPNPMENELVVDVTALHSVMPVALVIYDITGRAVHETSSQGNVKIDVGSYLAGVYVLMIKTDRSVSMKKVIKK